MFTIKPNRIRLKSDWKSASHACKCRGLKSSGFAQVLVWEFTIFDLTLIAALPFIASAGTTWKLRERERRKNEFAISDKFI